MADCPIPANGDVIRVTRLDNCGRPVEGPDNAFVDECFASVAATANLDEGTDITARAANGKLCGFKKARPSLLGYDLTISVLHASPELYEIMTGQEVVTNVTDEVVGWSDCDVKAEQGFALELWQEILGIPCPEGVDGVWLYWLYPWVSYGRLGDVTIGEEAVTFEIFGSTRQDSAWCQGPWDVMLNPGEPPEAGPLLTPIGAACNEWRRVFRTNVAPPAADCAYIEVPENHCSTA